ncbi:MAG: hypothetical protein LBJ68_00215 [Endomicrobium sp.]|jgi:hypothetical protein|nr:hypothetical protein [Endomicrobium sp.]
MKIKSLSLKGKYCVLFSVFFIFLSLIEVPYTHSDNSVSNETTQETKTEKKINFSTIYDEFVSKCIDLSVDAKGIKESYQKYMKALKKYIKEGILHEKKYFKNIKKNYYKYISKEEQKEIERVTRNYIQAIETRNKMFISVSNAVYELAKADRNKSPNAKYEIEKAEKNFDVVHNKIPFMLTKLSVAGDEYMKVVYSDILTIKKMKEIQGKKFSKNIIRSKQIRYKKS